MPLCLPRRSVAPCSSLGLLLLVSAFSAGCGGGNNTGVDAGLDGALPDGAVVLPDGNVIYPDAGLPDGAVVLPDGNVIYPDAGELDAGPIPDLDIPPGAGEIPPECFGSDGNVDLCGCLTTANCSSTACPGGTTCQDDGCGGQRCIAAGHPCVDATDCPAGGTCEDSSAGRSCRSPNAACREDRECPLGFACEGAACVDRRVPCENEPLSCPIGYVCDLAQQQMQAYCRRIDVPCGHSSTCAQPGACIDLDGDGSKECVTDALQCVPSLCAPDNRICGPQYEEKGYTCGFLGSCAVQPCATPFECVDFAGDGRPFCAAVGSCDANSDCPPRQVCAIPHSGTSTTCVASATGGTP